MLEKCTNTHRESILKYIGDKYSECLYLYIDLMKYGLENEHFDVWFSWNLKKELTSIIARYYTGIHIFSKNNDLIIPDILNCINDVKPTIITGLGQIIENLEHHIQGYTSEYGKVGKISKVNSYDGNGVIVAKIDDINEIAKLLFEDEGLGGHYELSILENQIKERYLQKFGRNYILKKDGIIVSHCATYAEFKNIAVTSGVITKSEYRKKGLVYKVYSKLCDDLLSEGFEVYTFFYTIPAHKMHERVGFKIINSWGKLIKV